MRTTLISGALAAAALAGFATVASAQYRRVCAIYADGSMLCYYDNMDQCYAAISGLGPGTTCTWNPAYNPREDRRTR
jgi:hypothetical protein